MHGEFDDELSEIEIGDLVDVDLGHEAFTGCRVIDDVEDVNAVAGAAGDSDFSGPGYVVELPTGGELVVSAVQVVPGSKAKHYFGESKFLSLLRCLVTESLASDERPKLGYVFKRRDGSMYAAERRESEDDQSWWGPDFLPALQKRLASTPRAYDPGAEISVTQSRALAAGRALCPHCKSRSLQQYGGRAMCRSCEMSFPLKMREAVCAAAAVGAPRKTQRDGKSSKRS